MQILKSRKTEKDRQDIIKEEIREVSILNHSAILDIAKELFDDNRSWSLFHTLNECKTTPSLDHCKYFQSQHQAEISCLEVFTKISKEDDALDNNTLSIFGQDIFEAYLCGNKSIYE